MGQVSSPTEARIPAVRRRCQRVNVVRPYRAVLVDLAGGAQAAWVPLDGHSGEAAIRAWCLSRLRGRGYRTLGERGLDSGWITRC